MRICRRFAPGDEITLTLPKTQRLNNNHNPKTLKKKRGPLVDWLEDSDQPGETPLEERPRRGQLETEWRGDLFGGAVVVRAPGRVRDSERTYELRAIPYALWANRGPSATRVWIPIAEATAP